LIPCISIPIQARTAVSLLTTSLALSQPLAGKFQIIRGRYAPYHRRLGTVFLPGIPIAAAADSLALYSDACWHVEAGDLLGTRIGVIRLSGDTYVFAQEAGGDWNQPFIAKATAADLKRGRLTFTISDAGKPVSFHGTISEKIVTGQFDGWQDFSGKPLVVHLSRVPTSKKGVPDCR
jgi:hypothetical protein